MCTAQKREKGKKGRGGVSIEQVQSCPGLVCLDLSCAIWPSKIPDMCQTAMNFDSIVLIFSGFPVLNWPVLLYVIILKSPKLRKQEIITQLF